MIEKFLLIDDWRERITGVIVMTASPQDAMEREKGFLRVEGAKGSIMNSEVLKGMLENTKETVERLKRDFRLYTIDTSSGDTKNNPQRTAEKVVDIVLSLVEEQLQEDILCLPKDAIAKLFQGKIVLNASDAPTLSKLFAQSGEFHPREEVEENQQLVQALPVVVVRNKSGDVLRLRRREKSEQKILHEKIVIWAGGHVRKEDARNGDSLVQCALREIQEELRLSLEAKDLSLVGAIYADVGESTSKHVALVYEWRAETDDVAVALSSVEFFERRGTSLSGKFVSLEELGNCIETKRMSEVWSKEIVNELLGQNASRRKRLF
jgi:predicted NUDIX family phosphoesterase